MQGKSVFRQAMLAYEALIKTASSFQSLFLLAVRLYWGWQFAQTGWGKLQHLPKVANFFATLGIPAPAFAAVAISWLEFIGGIGLALGLGSQFWGLLLAGDMFVAYLTAGRQSLLAIFSDPGKFYGDDAYTFLFAAVLILIFGPGKFAVDLLLKGVFSTNKQYDRVSSVRFSDGRPATSIQSTRHWKRLKRFAHACLKRPNTFRCSSSEPQTTADLLRSWMIFQQARDLAFSKIAARVEGTAIAAERLQRQGTAKRAGR
jgi:putative oxidoreductase